MLIDFWLIFSAVDNKNTRDIREGFCIQWVIPEGNEYNLLSTDTYFSDLLEEVMVSLNHPYVPFFLSFSIH